MIYSVEIRNSSPKALGETACYYETDERVTRRSSFQLLDRLR